MCSKTSRHNLKDMISVDREESSPESLEGVKVADFTWAGAGPVATKYLADAGATVVKIESATRPDVLRTSGPYKDDIPGLNRCLYFALYNANKYSLSLDLNNHRGIEVAKKLVMWADIVSDSFRPGQMEKWGMGYDELRKIKPEIIMFQSSIQGQTGPNFQLPGTGNQLTGLAGFTYLTGWPDREAVQPFGGYSDFIACRFGAVAILGALEYRERTGRGQHIDLSQFEASCTFLAPEILDYTVNRRIDKRRGNHSPYMSPHGVYKCKGEDRWCAISVSCGEEWEAFCQVLGRAELVQDPKFATLVERKRHENELDREIGKSTQNWIAEELMRNMQEAGVASAVVQNTKDVYLDPNLKSRGYFWSLDNSEIGKATHLGRPYVMSKTSPKQLRAFPCLGEHSEFVCREFLGMSNEEFVKLVQDGAFGN